MQGPLFMATCISVEKRICVLLEELLFTVFTGTKVYTAEHQDRRVP